MKNQLKILIADDSPVIISRLKSILAELDMVTVIGEAGNGNEVMSFLKIAVPDVVLLDVKMPGANGIDVLADIKKNYEQVKIIMLTNQSNAIIRSLCLNMGANFFFDKSTEFEKLPDALQQLALAKKNVCID